MPGNLCQTQGMTTDENTPSNQPQRPVLKVIDGGRAHIERAALNAVFSDPTKLPDLLKRLSRSPVCLGLVPPVGFDA